MIPGSNLLKFAFKIIAKQTVLYYQNTNRKQNAAYNFVPVFADPVNLKGSVQAVQRNRYTQMNLDFNRDYVIFYTLTNLLDLQRGVSGDQIAWEGRIYKCEAKNPWFKQDAWVGILCVDIGPVEVPKK